jgi:hypothetical protein
MKNLVSEMSEESNENTAVADRGEADDLSL